MFLKLVKVVNQVKIANQVEPLKLVTLVGVVITMTLARPRERLEFVCGTIPLNLVPLSAQTE